MRIIQIVPVLNYGDAVGNDILTIDRLLKTMGIETVIYTTGIGKRIPGKLVKLTAEWKRPNKCDVLIYHMASAFNHISFIKDAPCRKIAIYHNVTPAGFFKPYNLEAYRTCVQGLEQVKSLNNTFDYILAASEFNKQDLISYGYTCKIDVLPILIPFKDYKRAPDSSVIKKYKGKGTNILFVGRVVPNKKQEDLIAVFYLYKKYYNRNARLFIVGKFDEYDAYCKRLLTYIDLLGLKDDIIIPGHSTFEEILGYYASADIFLCLSEHEGFCVPLVEAMLFDVPIIAYDKCAVGETLGKGSILIKDKNFLEIAGNG